MDTPRTDSMRLWVVALLCSLLTASSAEAQPCPATVLFSNGVSTDQDDAALAAVQLGLATNRARDLALRMPMSCFESIYALDGIRSESGPALDDILDLVEALGQRFTDYLRVVASRYVLVEYNSNSTLQQHARRYRELLNNSDRVVVVAHSQGNLFANESRAVLMNGFDGEARIASGRIRIVGVSTPAISVPGTDEHITLLGDPIVLTQALLVAPQNTDPVGSECLPAVSFALFSISTNLKCHEFVPSYLAGLESRRRIVDQINAVAKRNTLPVAGFTLSSSLVSVTEGQRLSLAVSPGMSARVRFDPGRSGDSDEPLVSMQWQINGVPATASSFERDFYAGIHNVVLTVTDLDGATAQATATIEVCSTLCFSGSPIARDDSGPGYSVTQAGVLMVPAPGVMTNDLNALGATVEFLAPLPIGLTSPTSLDGSFRIDLTAHPMFTGSLAFQYRLRRGLEVSNQATVTVSVTPTTTTSELYAQTDATAVQSPVNSSTSYWIQTRIHTASDPTWLVRKIVLPLSIADFSAFGVSQLTESVCRHFDVNFPLQGTTWNGGQNNISHPFGAALWQGVTITADASSNTCTYFSDAGLVILEAGIDYDLVPTSQSDLTTVFLPVGTASSAGHAGRFGHFTFGNNANPTLSGDVHEMAVVLCADDSCSPTFSRQSVGSAVRLNWTIEPDGNVIYMQPVTRPYPNGMGWHFLYRSRTNRMTAVDACDGDGGSGGPVGLFDTGTSFITFLRSINVFGTTNDAGARGGLGTPGCTAAGYYYVQLTDFSTSSSGAYDATYFYELYYDGVSTVTAINNPQ